MLGEHTVVTMEGREKLGPSVSGREPQDAPCGRHLSDALAWRGPAPCGQPARSTSYQYSRYGMP
jgi:hypothetical protein